MIIKVLLHGKEIKSFPLEMGKTYSGGRASESDVVLQPLAGISRHHFKILQENEMWTIQSNSKYGEILFEGQPVTNQNLDIGQTYRVSDYEIRIEDDPPPAPAPAVSDQNAIVPIGHGGPGGDLPPGDGPIVDGANALAVQSFEGSEEATIIKPIPAVFPQVRVAYRGGREEIFPLTQGKRWIGGRDETCEIRLDHPKASRRQFEIVSSPQGFFVRDLGSANGTALNGQMLEPDELRPIQSGDILAVKSVQIFFEVKDAQFEKKLMVVPQEMMNLPAVTQSPYEVITYPVVQGPGGAIRLYEEAPKDLSQFDPRTNKKARIYAIIGVLILVLMGGYFFGEGDTKPQTKDEFSKLTPKKQQEVKEAYLLAKNLHAQKKYELALAQIEKIHKLLPAGFEDSMVMAEQCRATIDAEQTRLQIEEQKRRQQEILQKIEANVRECLPKADVVGSVQEMQSCLSTALQYDPSHSLVVELLNKVKRRIDDAAAEQLRKAEYHKRVLQGKALYNKAAAFEAAGNLYEAVLAYEKHIGSEYPDPDGLKTKSRNAVSKIKKSVTDDIGKLMAAAKAAQSAGSYREAMAALDKAKRIDASNSEVSDMIRAIRKEKDAKLQEIYSESVILEGLSKITDAKDKWRQIVEQDFPGELYYGRAQSKLKQYGRMGDGK